MKLEAHWRAPHSSKGSNGLNSSAFGIGISIGFAVERISDRDSDGDADTERNHNDHGDVHLRRTD